LSNSKGTEKINKALGVGRYFGIELEFWLNLQLRYNMKIAISKMGKID